MTFFNVYFAKMLLFYLFKKPEKSVANASLAAEYAQAAIGFMMIGTHNFLLFAGTPGCVSNC
jgi:hypothetical protein